MHAKLAVVLAVIAPVALAGGPARAGHTSPILPCVVDVADASADTPHIVDPAGDWNGLTGNETEGVGDLYREGVDLLAAWFARDADGGLDAVTQIADVNELRPNTIYYFIWYYPDTDGDAVNRSTRWASARFRGYAEPVFTYGYLGPGVTGGIQFFTDGTTTGTVASGAPGTIAIDLPLAAMGIEDTPGEYFTLVDVAGIPGSQGVLGPEARILLGSPEPLPPPSPLRHGFVYEADTSDNFEQICDARL